MKESKNINYIINKFMSFEKPIIESKEAGPKSFEQEMVSLESALQNLIDGKLVHYEKQMVDVQNELERLENKYIKDLRIAEFLKRAEKKLGIISLAMGGALVLLLNEKMIGAGIAVGGTILATAGLYAESKFSEQALKIVDDIRQLINTSREFTYEYLKKGGTVYVKDEGVKDERLHVTDEQVEKARGEMNKDLGKRGKV